MDRNHYEFFKSFIRFEFVFKFNQRTQMHIDLFTGIIFVVDSCDHERFEEARIELMKIAKNAETIGVPIVILANKQDLPNARTVDELDRKSVV